MSALMNKKLTLHLDERLIKRAKKYARKKGTSVSQIVANYFKAIEEPSPKGNNPHENDLPPITSSLSGILKDVEIDETDYRKHLEDRHLK